MYCFSLEGEYNQIQICSKNSVEAASLRLKIIVAAIKADLLSKGVHNLNVLLP